MVPVAAGDPAALALAGLLPGSDVPVGPPPSDDERAALAVWAERWIDATAARLQNPPEDRAQFIVDVASRRGEIVAELGWIEVHLELDAVDLDVRRAGLDIDPGWVSWLGIVVRFVYE
jgi:hypothetical protein